MKRRCGRLLHPRNAAKLSACKSVLIGLTQTHSQPARTPMSPVMKVSYLRLRLWTFWMLFFCLRYYKLPLINPKKVIFYFCISDKKIFFDIISVSCAHIYTHMYIYCTAASKMIWTLKNYVSNDQNKYHLSERNIA